MAKKRRSRRRRSRARSRQPQPQPERLEDFPWTQLIEGLTGVPMEQLFEQDRLTPEQAYNMAQMSMVQLLGFDEAAAAAFMSWHDAIPADIERWSEEQLEAVVSQARTSGEAEDWKRAMTWLSHHRTRWAAQRLDELLDLVPQELKTFWDLAFAEAAAWLSYKAAEAEEMVALATRVGDAAQMN